MIKAAEFLAGPAPKDWKLALISGEEEFLRDESIAHLLSVCGEEVEVCQRDGSGEVDLADLLDDLSMRDLFGGQRIFVISNSDELVKNHGETLERFIRNGSSVHPFILEGRALVAKSRKTAPTKGVPGVLAKSGGVVVSCGVLYDAPFQGRGPEWQSPLSRWVTGRAQMIKKRMTMQDAYLLHRLVGNKLRELDAEIRKLAVFVGDRTQITGEDIERCVGGGRLEGIFSVAEAYASGNTGESVDKSQLVFERGVTDFTGRLVRDPHALSIMLVNALAGRLRRIGLARELTSAGTPFEEAANTVGQPAFARAQLKSQMAVWAPPGALAKATGLLLRLDADLKTGGGDPRILWDRFLVEGAPEKTMGGQRWGR